MSSKTLRSMARIYMTYGQYDKAEKMARMALEMARKTSADTEEMGMCLIDLGTVYSQEGMLVEAQRMLSKGIQYQAQAMTNSHPYVAHSLRMLCDVYRRQGKLDFAQQTLNQAMAIMLKSHTYQSREMASFYLESAKLQSAKGEYAAAGDTYRTALQMVEESFGSDHLLTASVLTGYAEFHLRTGNLFAGGEMIEKALTIQNRYYGPEHPLQVDAWLIKARFCRLQGDRAGSKAYIARALDATSQSRNVVSMAALHERISRLGMEDQIAAAL